MEMAPGSWRIGTCKQGQIEDTSYNELRHCFGEPHYSDMSNDQITKEWVITIEGVVLSISRLAPLKSAPVRLAQSMIGGGRTHSTQRHRMECWRN